MEISQQRSPFEPSHVDGGTLTLDAQMPKSVTILEAGVAIKKQVSEASACGRTADSSKIRLISQGMGRQARENKGSTQGDDRRGKKTRRHSPSYVDRRYRFPTALRDTCGMS